MERIIEMKVHETRSHAHGMGEEEGKMTTRKQKAEARVHETEKNKKAKPAETERVKSVEGFARDFPDFCKAVSQHLSIEDMRKLLEANAQEASGSDEDLLFRWYVLNSHEISLTMFPFCMNNDYAKAARTCSSTGL